MELYYISSKELFEDTDVSIQSLAEFNLSEAKENDFVFIENEDIQLDDYTGELEYYFYKWPSIYPSDKTLELPLNDAEVVKKEQFNGNSHDKIYLEIWRKK